MYPPLYMWQNWVDWPKTVEIDSYNCHLFELTYLRQYYKTVVPRPVDTAESIGILCRFPGLWLGPRNNIFKELSQVMMVFGKLTQSKSKYSIDSFCMFLIVVCYLCVPSFSNASQLPFAFLKNFIFIFFWVTLNKIHKSKWTAQWILTCIYSCNHHPDQYQSQNFFSLTSLLCILK